MDRFLNSCLMGAMGLMLAITSAFSQTEDMVVVNEIVLQPATGKEYVELLVLQNAVDLRGWTVSDCNNRSERPTSFHGDITLPSFASYLANVPLGTYIVIELSTPRGNTSILPEDLSLSDATPRRLIIKTTTPGVNTSGTLDFNYLDNATLFAGSRASGTLIDEVLWGSTAGYIAGASWGDNNASTILDNINNGSDLPPGAYYNLRFVPTNQSTWAGFQANDTKAVWPLTASSYGTPGYVNTGVSEPSLPVQLAGFTVTRVGINSVLLEWLTVSEVNNFGFYVQRRADTDTEFTDLANAFIPGHGTTLQPQHYSFTDATVAEGGQSYRLRQVDLDGSIHYSDPIRVDIVASANDHQKPAQFTLEQNYPNPFNPTTAIQYSLPSSAHVTLKLYSMVGQEMLTLVNEEQAAGTRTVQLGGSNLASGVYLYTLTAGSFLETKRLVLMK